MPNYECIVDEVGAAVDGTETALPVVYVQLTDVGGSFANTWFYAADELQELLLDAGIAAIGANKHVQATLTAPKAGNTPYTAVTRMDECVAAAIPPHPRTITVTKRGTGATAAAQISGSGFTPKSLIDIRIESATVGGRFSTTASANGTFSEGWGFACVPGSQITFSAYEDANPLATMSNSVTMTC